MKTPANTSHRVLIAGLSVGRAIVILLCVVGLFVVTSLANSNNVLTMIVGLQYCNFAALLAIVYLLVRRRKRGDL